MKSANMMQMAGLVALSSALAIGQQIATGPDVGARIPAFELPDREGNLQTFDSLKGENGMLLAFVRSADWCPFCKTQLVDLNSQLARFKAEGVGVVSVSYDTQEVLSDFGERQDIGFPMLSDRNSAAIKAFGILNTTVDPNDDVYGIPFPGMYVLDANGVVKAKYFEDSFQERYSAAAVLTREFGANGVEMQKAAGDAFNVTAYASDEGFAPGRRITLVLEIEPKAAGLTASQLNWQMAEGAAWESYEPEVLNTGGTIRIMRDIKVLGSRQIADAVADGTLTVAGSLTSGNATLPLQWIFRIGQMETERVPEAIRMR